MLHGGEVYNGIEIRHDFSVNINPLGIPEEVFGRLEESFSLLTQYPDQECRALRQALEKFTAVPARQILCGNGASELIEAAVRGLEAESILLTAPSFSGYRHAAKSHGSTILYHTLRREEDFALTERFLEDLAQRPDMAVLCSPSNPIGNRIDPALLLRIAETCRQQGTWLMVDECFLGFLPDEDARTMRRFLVGSAANPRLLVLDAFTKRFAMPGIRLGYLMAADPGILEKIHAQQPEWSVSLAAQTAGIAALEASAEYMQQARALVASERGRMAAALEKLGCKVFPGEANYLFFSTEMDLYELLLQRGILIRCCENYRGLRKGDYRAAVLRPEENAILLQAMKEIAEGKC